MGGRREEGGEIREKRRERREERGGRREEIGDRRGRGAAPVEDHPGDEVEQQQPGSPRRRDHIRRVAKGKAAFQSKERQWFRVQKSPPFLAVLPELGDGLDKSVGVPR